MSRTKEKAEAVKQLEILIRTSDLHGNINIEGAILDYLGKSKKTLYDVLELNRDLYERLFVGGEIDKGSRLVHFLCEGQKENDALYHMCCGKYPEVCNFLKRPPTVVWQLSDIHFGKLNMVENNPDELASLLSKATKEYPELKPCIILISGDITSFANEDEFGKFVDFSNALGTKIWGKPSPERILLVPGNHDVAWEKNGETDKLNGFITHVTQKNCCITPLTSSREYATQDGKISVTQFVSGKDTPPIVEVCYEYLNLRFILLTSSYFSGTVPVEIRKLFSKIRKNVQEELSTLIRQDKGDINIAYLNDLASLDIKDGMLSIALIHHNPVTYETETAVSRYYSELLATLYRRNIPLVLHGHTHLEEIKSIPKHVNREMAYPVSCPSLCAVPSAGSRNGMHAYVINNINDEYTINAIQCPVYGIGLNFHEAVLSYIITASKEKISVNSKFRRYKR